MCFRTDSISSFLRKNQTMLHVETKTRVEELRTLLHQYKPPKPDPDLKRDLQPGWLMPYLLKVDAYTWGVGTTGFGQIRQESYWMNAFLRLALITKG
jgi:hypothetical protein